MGPFAFKLNILVRFAFAAILALLLGPGEVAHVRALFESRTETTQSASSSPQALAGWRLKTVRAATADEDRPDASLDTGAAPRAAGVPGAPRVVHRGRHAAFAAIAPARRHRPRAPPLVA